jgi:hypothetical protein
MEMQCNVCRIYTGDAVQRLQVIMYHVVAQNIYFFEYGTAPMKMRLKCKAERTGEDGLWRNVCGGSIITTGCRNRYRSLWLAYIITEVLTEVKCHMAYGTV